MKKIMSMIFCICILLTASGCQNQNGKDPQESIHEQDMQGEFLPQGGPDPQEAASPVSADIEDTEMAAIENDAVILKIGDIITTYEEILLYFRSYKQKIEGLYGPDIWDLALGDDGFSYADLLKENILNELEYIKIICAQAELLDVSLGEDEKLDVDEYTADYMAEFTEDELLQYGITKEIVEKIYGENVLANKIYELLTLNVDTDVEDEEVRYAVFQYIFISKYAVDEEGNKTAYTDEELELIKEYAQEVHMRAGLENFYELAMECSEDEDEIEFTAGRQDMLPEFAEETFLLQEGGITELLENEDGYFIFFCKNEMDELATEEAKIALILERQQTAFDESFAKWEMDTEIELNEKLWEQIQFGEAMP